MAVRLVKESRPPRIERLGRDSGNRVEIEETGRQESLRDEKVVPPVGDLAAPFAKGQKHHTEEQECQAQISTALE